MFTRTITVGLTLLAAAAPITAQQRGTVEFGAFASNTSFESSLGLNNSWGAGGLVGAFLFPRLSIEFEGGGSKAGRTLGLQDVNVGILSARLTGVPLKRGRVSMLLGAGVDHSDTFFMESYGFHGLLGAKVALTEAIALRVGVTRGYLVHVEKWNNNLHVGLSVYRNPRGTTSTVTRTETVQVTTPAAQRPDSVSAAETRRLRADALSYRALRDSLAVVAVIVEANATMIEMIHFEREQSALSAAAMAALRDKVAVLRDNPTMRITIVGFASQPGTDEYNMALGLRRAEAARTYMVSQGVAQSRIGIATRGEGQLLIEGPGAVANAANRRSEFMILVPGN